MRKTPGTKQPGWSRRLVTAGGAALVLGGGYFAVRPGTSPVRRLNLDPHTLYRGNAAEPQSLDPCLAQGAPEEEIMGDLLTGLIEFDPHAKPVPGMATSWTTSADGLVWTFKLREALWSDATPVTAEDFVFSWRRILDPATAAPYAYFLYVIRNASAINAGKMPVTTLGARAIDARTLEMTLVHPAPYLLEMLTHMTMYPQPRHVVAAKGRNWARPGSYVGNGAYLLKSWVTNDHIALVKNPRFYAADKVAIERVMYYPTDDYGAALRRFRAGELDFQDRLPTEEIGWIKQNLPETIDPVPQLVIDFIAVNLGRPPFDDVRIRAALDLAINREAISAKILRGAFLPAYNIVPPGTANYPGSAATGLRDAPHSRRIAKAQALMRAAGFGPGRRVRATYLIRSTSAGLYRAVAAALQQMLSLIYIDIAIIPNDMTTFYNTIQQHDFDMAQPGWQADFDDAATFLDLFRTGGGNNWGQYSNPAFDAMLNAAQRDTDITNRGRKLVQAETIVLKDHAVMPLYFWLSGNMVRPYVKGWAANNMDVHRTRWASIDHKARRALFA